MKKWGNLTAIALNIGGLVLWLARLYGLLFVRGVAAHPAENLNAIVLFASVPILGAAAIYSRKLFEDTGNSFGGGGGGGGTFLGTQRPSPGKMILGLGMCGVAVIKESSDTPKHWTMENIESPSNLYAHCFTSSRKYFQPKTY